ncbi:hypothetical protein KR038_009411, partial [Drosophila bunnanda]
DASSLNCTLPTILEFPPIMRKKSWWAVVISTFISIYIFVILAIVCDDYLIPAMERVCFALKMSYDVAGATFLAASTSAPELFINVMGTFVTHSDIGVGTVVGSTVFNILVISAVVGILTKPTKVNWWPVTRDSLWYLVSIIALIVAMWDSRVYWYEGLALLFLYAINFIQLFFDKKIKAKLTKSKKEQCIDIGLKHSYLSLLETGEEEEEGEELKDPMSPEELEQQKTFRNHVWGAPPKGSKWWKWLWWLFKYPAELLLALTIPTARTAYVLTLIISVIWIIFISYLVTWCITIIGHNVGIPDSIMGLTFLASGTSVPEIITSFIVSRKGEFHLIIITKTVLNYCLIAYIYILHLGHGAMALCNALGSNTFDILVCLGLPWFMLAVTGIVVRIDSAALHITTAMLLVTPFILYFTLLSSRFIMGKVVGWVCLLSYVVFITIVCVLEMMLEKTNICDIEA